MAEFNFSKEQVQYLLAGDEQAFRGVLKLARKYARYEVKRKQLSEEDFEDIIMTSLADVLTVIHDNNSVDPTGLTQELKRSIWRNAQRLYRRNKRDKEGGSIGPGIDALDIPDTSISLVSSREVEELIAERLASNPEYADLVYIENKHEEAYARSRIDLLTVDDELIRYFQRHPEKMYELTPRTFEEVVAAILRDLGYSIELTAPSADGGIDIFATPKSAIGELLLIVDCKRYAPTRHVGVEIVRSMYGISEQLRVTMGMIATTSFFTKPALEFQRTVRHRISLRDYDGLTSWLSSYGAAKGKGLL